MRKSVRTLAATALAVPMTLGAAGMAFADTEITETTGQEVTGSATSGQQAGTGQGNGSFAPVSQVNPAANASDIAGLSDFANEDATTGSDQTVVQDNSVASSNEQGNKASTEQAQKTVLEQLTSLG